jgi:undecaprenyl-diphosphatase
VFVALSRIGTGGFVWILLAVALTIASRRLPILWTVPVVVASDAVALGIKSVVDRPRPHLDPLVRVPTDWSFPSGHATTSFAGATMLAHFAPRWRPALYLLAAAIAFSRVYVGVHYPFDVLAGAALGLLLGFGIARARQMLAAALRRSAPPTQQG